MTVIIGAGLVIVHWLIGAIQISGVMVVDFIVESVLVVLVHLLTNDRLVVILGFLCISYILINGLCFGYDCCLWTMTELLTF